MPVKCVNRDTCLAANVGTLDGPREARDMSQNISDIGFLSRPFVRLHSSAIV